ncbi:MAG: hypothetical protein ACYCOR_17840 [Acidobacteriaceae bacterium]
MNILVIDMGQNALDFILRSQAYGHSVKWFLSPNKDGIPDKAGEGMGIQKVKAWEPWMRWAELVFLTDNVKYLHRLEPYRKFGYPIFGPSVEGAELELDREKGQKALKKAGVPILDSKTFTSYELAEKYVLKEDKAFVSKPSGDADKALSYVSKSPKDMIFMLRRWKRLGKLKAPFILQEFVPGIEMAVGGWIGPEGFLPHFCENFEFKKLMNDDLGVNTGEQGTVMAYTKKSKLAKQVLTPLTETLVRLGITGYVDVNCIVAGDHAWPLEFTVRPGWPTFQIQQALHIGDPATWMGDLLEGHATLKVSDETATGVVLSIPDYPYSKLTKKEVQGIPIYGYEKVRDDLHPAEVMEQNVPHIQDGKVVESPGWVTAGDYLLIATGTHQTVKGSASKAYKTLKALQIPNSPSYRTDIGKRLKAQLPKLHDHGYATHIHYEGIS